MGWGKGGGLSPGFYACGRAEGGAERGLPAWALSTVLIRPPRPCSPSGRRVPRVSPSSFSQRRLRAFGSPPGSSRPGSRGSRDSQDGIPLPRPRSACVPSPAPPTAPPRQSQVPPLPYLPPPAFPPTARSPVPVTLLGVYAWSPPRTPHAAPRTRRPGAPGARAQSPGSLAVADGATAPAGAAKPGRS